MLHAATCNGIFTLPLRKLTTLAGVAVDNKMCTSLYVAPLSANSALLKLELMVMRPLNDS